MVLFNPEPKNKQYMIKRGWLHLGTPLVKYVFAVSGDQVCVDHGHLSINHHVVADILPTDSQGRFLPKWQYCGKVPTGELLLLSTNRKNSFDSRYFGFVPEQQVVSLVSKFYGGNADA